MTVVYASRTGNVQSIVDQLTVDQLVDVNSGESVSEEYILITYTDGYGEVPEEVDAFLSANPTIKGVIVSGDTSYGEAYCGAGDVIAEAYNVPVLYKVENDGTDEDIANIQDLCK